MPMQLQSRRVPLLAWMVLIALAIRLAVIPFDRFEDLMDAGHLHAWEQGNVAESIVAGHGFGSPFQSHQPSAIMPPVYPLVVALFFRLFGIHTAASIFAVHAFDCLVNALEVIPLFFLARHSFGPRVARWACWTWVFFPYGIYFASAWAWSTHLLLLCVSCLLYLSQDLEHSQRPGAWARFGLLAGLAGLTEPSSLVVSGFLLALCAWRLAHTGLPWLRQALTATVLIAAVLSPWIVRNAIVFHRFIPMRDSMGLELWMGNNGYTVRWTSDQIHPLHDARELALYNEGEVAYMALKSQQAHAWIAAHPRQYAVLCLRRAIFLWTGYWSFHPDYLAMEPTDPANIPFALCLTSLGLAGLWIAWRRGSAEALRYAGVLFLFPAIYYFSHPEPYHMRPLDPLLIVLGCYAIEQLRQRAKSSREAGLSMKAVSD
jgi:4-amino-4-deoxy-L-arabinose transferase-like glycosyltransferase